MRRCTVCAHRAITAIEADLRDGRPAQAVALAYGLGPDAVQRHSRNHLGRSSGLVASALASNPGDLLATAVASKPGTGLPIDELVEALRTRALAGDPLVSREYRLALAAQDAARASSAPPLDLATAPEWVDLRGRIMAALGAYPDARQAVAEAIDR